MSVITSFDVFGERNLKEELTQKGIVAPGELYSERQKKMVSFDCLLDYRKCPESVVKEIKDSVSKRHPESRDWGDEKWANYLQMPVGFSEDGKGMYWSVNYGYDDMPGVAIAKLYPEDVFAFTAFTENELDCSYCFKGMDVVTPNGEKCEGSLVIAHVEMDNGDGTSLIKLPYGRQMQDAYMVVKNDDLMPHNLRYPVADEVQVAIRDVNAPIVFSIGSPDGQEMEMSYRELSNHVKEGYFAFKEEEYIKACEAYEQEERES